MRIVYVGMAADILHEGHIVLLRRAATIGSVTVGLITDSAICRYKDPPAVPFSSRKAVVESLRFVDDVVSQEEPSPVANLLRIRPDVFVHGDDWSSGPLLQIRSDVMAALGQWGGRLEEFPYTPGISSSSIKDNIRRSIPTKIFAGMDLA